MTGHRGKGKGQGPAKGRGNGNPAAPPFDSTTGRIAGLRRAELYEMTRGEGGRWTGFRPRVTPRARSGDNADG